MASRSSARRKLVWATNSGAGIVVTPGTVLNPDLLSNLRTGGASVLGATVMRTHMRFSIQWETTSESGQQFQIGLTVADMDLITPTARITPAERGRDWALLDGFMPGTGLNSYANTGSFPAEGFIVDLRSKRKVQELNQTWVLAATYVGGTTSISVSYWARTLLALP